MPRVALAVAVLAIYVYGLVDVIRTAGEVDDALAEDHLVDSHPDVTIRNDAKKREPRGGEA